MTAHAIPPVATGSRPRVLPLEPGDHLTREEFERRYDATPGLKKAELIEGVVDWFALEGTQYVPVPAEDGVVRSRVFPGFWLDPSALIRGDMVTAAAVLQRGIASAEHVEFVKMLQGRKSPR